MHPPSLVDCLRTAFGIQPGEVDLSTFPLFGPALGMASVAPEIDASRPGEEVRILTYSAGNGSYSLVSTQQEVISMLSFKLYKRLSLVPLLALCTISVTSLVAPTSASAASLIPLEIYWSKERGDNVTCGTEACRRAQVNTRGYRYLRVEGCIYDRRVEGTIPLVLYWSKRRKDNVTVANRRSRQEQENAGSYKYVRVEGYVYKNQVPGTIPLWLYWYGKRSDNATVASNRGVSDQRKTKGLQRVRVEGYVYPASRCV
jgi:hypothetical protein